MNESGRVAMNEHSFAATFKYKIWFFILGIAFGFLVLKAAKWLLV